MDTWDPYQALYLHIPFCKKRCNYCDFATQAISCNDSRLDSFTDDLIREIRNYSQKELLGEIKTVYLGGGTPSYLGNKRLSTILYALSISMHLTPEVECTLEANPESLTSAMVRDLFALGVNRISLGIQSFDDNLLKVLGRIHDSEQAIRAVDRAQERFTNISIDLMCGLPGQTVESFHHDLERAISLGIQHISVYPLTIEEGTPFARKLEKGELLFDEDLGALCMEDAHSYLTSRGMNHYEVASYAFPGFESRHNSAYWTSKPYLGLGCGAVSMRQNQLCRQRYSVVDGLIEELDIFQMTAEDLMLKMRMRTGVCDGDLEIASILLPEVLSVFCELEHEGFLVHHDDSWIPTHKGWMFGNQLYGRILDLAP